LAKADLIVTNARIVSPTVNAMWTLSHTLAAFAVVAITIRLVREAVPVGVRRAAACEPIPA
jgi:hypothetical protein